MKQFRIISVCILLTIISTHTTETKGCNLGIQGFSAAEQKQLTMFVVPQVVPAKGKYYIISQGNSDAFMKKFHINAQFPDTSAQLFEFNPMNATVKKISDVGIVINYFAACFFNGKIYIAGGERNDAKDNRVRVYDIMSKTWTTIASMHNARSNFGLEVQGEKLYAIGGDENGTIEYYSPETQKWMLDPTDFNKKGIHLAVIRASVTVENKIYLFAPASNFYVFTPSEGLVVAGLKPQFDNNFYDAVANNKRIYIGSGISSEGIDAMVYVYNTVDNTWQLAGKTVNPRYASGLAYFGNMLIYLGGLYGGNNGESSKTATDIYIYQPSK